MLPPDEAAQRAARLVEQSLLSAPWALTDAFVAHFRWVWAGAGGVRPLSAGVLVFEEPRGALVGHCR